MINIFKKLFTHFEENNFPLERIRICFDSKNTEETILKFFIDGHIEFFYKYSKTCNESFTLSQKALVNENDMRAFFAKINDTTITDDKPCSIDDFTLFQLCKEVDKINADYRKNVDNLKEFNNHTLNRIKVSCDKNYEINVTLYVYDYRKKDYVYIPINYNTYNTIENNITLCHEYLKRVEDMKKKISEEMGLKDTDIALLKIMDE